MRRGVQLYIAGRQVDLADDSWILFSWTREDLSNPTSTVNSSSNQITLPGTCRNNALLGSVFRLDRRTLFGSGHSGVNFDPMRKTPFILYDSDGTVLESGYCRLDAVNTRDRRHEYTVTLYGGLGSFFYHLAMKEDGTARTLLDLTWKDADGDDIDNFVMTPQAAAVNDAWHWLANGEYDMFNIWNVVNFAPLYNGLPDDFDASHAISDHDAFFNVPLERNNVDGDETADYTYKTGLDCALLNFTNPHTEWEVCDLRWYLQRPVVSVKAFIAAICDTRNNGGYTVNLDEAFFNDDNPAYADAWWTLPMIATADRESAHFLENLLGATRSPMAYLADYCKHFGLLFLWDSARRTVDIVTRATFYAEAQNDVIDLSARIDRGQQITQDPVLADKRWYQFGDGGKGAWVEQYMRDYGRGYAVQKVDTGYEFDAGTTVLTEGNAFKEAAEVAEASMLYTSTGVQVQTTGGWSWRNYLQIPRFEQVSVELWNADGESRTFDVQCPITLTYYDDPANPGTDWLPKVQAHGEDNKSQDGADVLVFFAGMHDTPTYGGGASTIRKRYHLSNDSAAMTDLAGGPCWDLTFTWTVLTSLPSFRRVVTSGEYITDSWEWGVPRVRAVPGIVYPDGEPTALYDRWWKRYLRDRYATDTRVLTCMVDLRGLPVGQALLRRFYWIDGALWTLNAIRNHPMTSWDLTECEFVKVGDKGAYTEGPGNLGSHYIVISPSAASFTADPNGGTLSLTVRSSSAWTLAASGAGEWATFSAESGSAGSSALVLTFQPNTGDARRSVNVTLTNGDGDTVAFTVSQGPGTPQSISLNPSSLEISENGTAVHPDVADRGRSVGVTATGAWAVDTSTVPSWITFSANTVANVLNIRVAANDTGSARSAAIKVYLTSDTDVYATLAVSQAAGEGGTGGITLTDSGGNTSATVTAEATTLTLYVENTNGQHWTIEKSESWGSLSSSSGTGDGSVTVAIPATTAARDQILTAKLDGKTQGAQFYLHQEAPAAPTYKIEVTRLENYFYNNTEVGAEAGWDGCEVVAVGHWTLTTPNSWIHPDTSMGSWTGSGNKRRFFYFDANTGAARTGTVVGTLQETGETATFYVYQAGNTTRTLDASFNKSNIDASAQTIYLSIQATSGLAWTISNVSSGLTPETYSGTGSAVIAVAVSAATAARTLSLRVKNTTYSLQANPSVAQAAPAPVETDYLRVTPFGTINVGPTDTSLTFSVECSTSWQVTTPATGVTITPSTGSGNATVTVNFGTNTGSSARTIALTFATTNGSALTKSATIVQAAPATTNITVTPTSLELSGAGQTKTVSVTADAAWTASKSDSWITLSASGGSAGSGITFSIGAGRNTGAPRTGSVTFVCGNTSRVVTVIQGSDATLSVSRNAVTLAKEQGSAQTVTVYSTGMWDIWEYSDVPIWLDVSMPSHAGSAQGETITFAAASANTSPDGRSVTIRLVLVDNPEIYQEIVVTQEGATYFYISPTQANPARNGGSGYFSVSCNTDWEVTDMDSGVTIPAEYQEGTGDAQVPWSVDANPYSFQRMMTVGFATVNEERTSRVYLIQDGTEISTDTKTIPFVSDGGDATMVVLATSPWAVVSKPDWITVAPASGAANNPNGQSLVVTAAQNTGSTERTGTIVFGVVGTDLTAETNVTQAAPTPQTLTISPTRVTLDTNRAYFGTLQIRCSGRWSIGNNVSPDGTISFTQMSGSGDVDVTFSVPANTSGVDRRLWASVTNQDGSIVRLLTVIQPA